MKKIVIVDDHPLVLAAVAGVITIAYPDVTVLCAMSAGEARTLVDADLAADKAIQLAFVDLNLPDENGMDLILELRTRYGMPVIALSGNASPEGIRECIRNGACGFVQKTAKMAIFPAAMSAVLSGGQYFPAGYINGGPFEKKSEDAISALTPRQIEVLNLVIDGKPNKVIAASLGLTEGTVKNHVGVLLQTFKVVSRSQLILATNRMGYNAGSKAGSTASAR